MGPWAAPAYILLFALLPVFFFPVAVLAFAGGLCFGLWKGTLYTLIGATVNCTLMYLLSRYAGRKQVESLLQKRLSPPWQKRLARLRGRDGFVLLILLRLIPAVPYNLINYAFGLSGMPLRTYLIASILGIIPGTVVFINTGDQLLSPGTPGFYLAIALLILLVAVTTVFGKIYFKENSHD